MSLKTEKGNIFQLDERKYDIAIAFVAGGFTGINTAFNNNFANISKSSIGYILYSDGTNPKIRNHAKLYKSRRELFESEEEIVEYIDNIVSSALDEAISIGNRIAISGIWIRGLEQIKNETWMVESVQEWLKSHTSVEITIVDIEDNINKHNILNK